MEIAPELTQDLLSLILGFTKARDPPSFFQSKPTLDLEGIKNEVPEMPIGKS
jgi:hypothetical protein